MAIEQEIFSFDLAPDKAIAQINQLVSNLNKLEKELQEAQKANKDTAKTQAELANTTNQLNKALSAEVNTEAGAIAKTKALSDAKSKLSQATNTAVQSTDRLDKNLSRASSGLARNIGKIQSFGGAAALAGASIANFSGAAALAGPAVGLLITATEKLTAAVIDYIDPVDQTAELTKQLSAEYALEKGTLDALFKPLRDNKASMEDKRKATQALVAEYGDYLPKIDLENASLQELEIAYQAVNNTILDNIIAKAKAAKAQELIQTVINKTIEATKAEQDAQQSLLQGTNFFVRSTAALLTLGVTEGVNALETGLDEVNKTLASSAVAEAKKEYEELDATFAKVRENLKGLGNFDFSAAGAAKANELVEKASKKSTKAVSEQRKEYELAQGSLAQLEKELSRIDKLLKEQVPVNDENKATIEALANSYNELKKQVEDARAEIELALNPPKARTTIQVDAIQVDEQAIREQIARALTARDLRIRIEQLEIQGIEEQAQIEAQRTAEVRKAVLVNGAKQAGKEVERINKKYDKIREAADLANQQRILSTRLQLLQIELDKPGEKEKKAIQKQIAETTLALDELATKQITLNVDTKEVDEASTKVKDLLNKTIDFASGLTGQIFDFAKANAENAVSELDNLVSKQRSTLEALLGNSESASAQQVQLEEERLRKLEDKRRQAAEREAVITQLQIAAQSALAIARAAAEGGGIASAFTIAATIASLIFGFAQARQAAENSFFEGTTYVERGNNPVGRDTIPAWINEGEAIIPTQTNKQYKRAIEAIYHKEIPSELMNDFARNWRNYEFLNLGLNSRIEATGLSLNGLMIPIQGKGQNKGLERKLDAINDTLSHLNRYELTERGLRKFVSSTVKANNKNSKKFK